MAAAVGGTGGTGGTTTRFVVLPDAARLVLAFTVALLRCSRQGASGYRARPRARRPSAPADAS